MMRNDCPCHKCKERKQECHSECEKYIAWSLEHEKEKARIRKIKAAESDYWGRKKDAMYRMVARIHRNEV